MLIRGSSATLADATTQFLRQRDLAPGTRRVYGLTLTKLAEDLGRERALDDISDQDLDQHLCDRYGSASVATFNRNHATIGAFLAWAQRKGHIVTSPLDGVERRRQRRTKAQSAKVSAIPYEDLNALWTRRDISVREKTLWRMLYETAARSEEVLTLNVEDLVLDDRSAFTTGKSGHAERIFWATGAARLLPQILVGRTSGPVFLTDRRPRRPMALADTDPTTGRVRLSYRRAAELFAEASSGWTLHQLRHSRLTHLAEENVDVSLLKAKSRHASLRSLERYVRPSDASVARLTAAHDPAARRRRNA